jgi:N6-adenosine-specific RNA methylase IME4
MKKRKKKMIKKKTKNQQNNGKIKQINLKNLVKSLQNIKGKKNGKQTLIEYGYKNPIKSYPENPNFIDIKTTKKKFDLIYADPPWPYPPTNSTKRRGINDYSTMTIHDICLLPINKISSHNAILLLWVTAGFLKEGFKVMKHWGFEYITVWLNWNKTNENNHNVYLGMGTYSRIGVEHILFAYKKNPNDKNDNKRHKFFPAGYHIVKNYDNKGNKKVILDETEYLLLGKIGNILPLRVNDPGKIISNIFEAPVDRKHHSKKPAKVYELIKKTFPHVEAPLELFSRNNTKWSNNKYWSVWGNECQFI